MKKFSSIVLAIVMIITTFSFNLNVSAEIEYTSGYYTYKLTNEKAEIVDVDTSIKGNVIVPSTLDGYAVTSIGFNAFRDCESLTGVNLQDGITIINTSAFSNCTRLANIALPDSLTRIGNDAFENTFYYNNSNNWQNGALYIDKYLIVLKTTVSGLYEIKPDTVLIADFAFQNCKELTGLTIGEKLRGIGDYAFFNCTNLKDVYITNINAWCSIDFPMGASNPFYYAENLYLNKKLVTHLIIPEDVKFIKNYIFYKLNCITNVTIPKSVIGIGEYAFYNCKNIANVYYLGDENSKTTIEIGNYNECLREAQWFYNSCIECTEHKYDNDFDLKCNICGAERSIYNSGNINNDEAVDLTDVVVLAQVVAKWSGVSYNEAALDVNGDEVVDLTDVTHLSQYVAGWKEIVLH